MKIRLEEILSFAEAQPDRAIAELASIVLEDRDSAPAWMAKGSIHFNREEYEQSAAAFSEVIRLRPHNEFASAGLFHSLWGTGQIDDAFVEMKRFFKEHGANHDSELATEYRDIVRTINSENAT